MSYARQETVRKTDLRVVKTRRSLDGAMRSLLGEKDFNSITVKEICDRAQTRKATFYNHFSDKDDLLAYMIYQQMDVSQRDGAVIDDPDDPSAYYCEALEYLMDFMEENESMFRRPRKGDAYSSSGIYKEVTQTVFLEKLKKERSEGNSHVYMPDMLAEIVAETMMQCAIYWFRHRDKVTKNETVMQFKELVEPIFEM